MGEERLYNVLTVGRSSIDLYSNDIGAPFEEIGSFAAFVGGSSTNIAIGSNRLGLKTVLLTAVGNDMVGRFIMSYLKKEGIETEYIRTIDEARSSAVILGIEPPDKFPLVYYRDNAADWHISTEDIDAIGMANVDFVVLSGTALAREPSRSTTLYAAEQGKANNTRVLLDLDFRMDQWNDPQEYSQMIQRVLPYVDMVLGTREELLASLYTEDTYIQIDDQQISAPSIQGDLDRVLAQYVNFDLQVILKEGANGASIITADHREQVPGFDVEVLNVLGAGDAFAAGLLYGLIKGWTLSKSVRTANACGAILVTKHGCSNFSPTESELQQFMLNHDTPL